RAITMPATMQALATATATSSPSLPMSNHDFAASAATAPSAPASCAHAMAAHIDAADSDAILSALACACRIRMPLLAAARAAFRSRSTRCSPAAR
ncbi:MAG: hypothetical protein ACO3IB_05970, partial [Phycisphaerales bacterium]